MALIELRRFDEAIVVVKKALRQNPSIWQLTAASRPPSPISDVTLRRTTRRRVCLRSIPPLQYRRISPGAAKNAKLFIEGLRKAGLPE